VPAYLVAATLEAVMAQRLVRRLCESCARPIDGAAESVNRLVPARLQHAAIMRAIGCDACRHTGYAGRLGVFELIVLTDAMRDAIARGATRAELQSLAEAGGWRPLLDDGWKTVELGLTTVEEVLRVASA
jgi:type II secretory ATPase GspE/PulE/Tfp pilus assembly ATPase PilB-like protein